jgi:hypothetical protein
MGFGLGLGFSLSFFTGLTEEMALDKYVPLIIFNGESNSGGIGLNSDLAAGKINPRSAVQILNNNFAV